MTWDPIGYLLNRTDRLERESSELRERMAQVETKTLEHRSRIGRLERWRKSLVWPSRWPIMAGLLILGIGLNIAPEQTAKVAAIVLKVVL